MLLEVEKLPEVFCFSHVLFSCPGYIFMWFRATHSAAAYNSHFLIDGEVWLLVTSCAHLCKHKQGTRRGQPSSAGLWWILWGKLSETHCASPPAGWRIYLGCSASFSALKSCFLFYAFGFGLLCVHIHMKNKSSSPTANCRRRRRRKKPQKIVWHYPA